MIGNSATDRRMLVICHTYIHKIYSLYIHVHTHLHINLVDWLIPTLNKHPSNCPHFYLFFLVFFFLINGMGHSVTDLTCKTENWVISRPFVGDNSNAECHQPLNSLPGEMCQSGSERRRARE